MNPSIFCTYSASKNDLNPSRTTAKTEEGFFMEELIEYLKSFFDNRILQRIEKESADAIR